MTPTEQDKELRELVHIVQNADTTYDAMQFITADRKRVALEARQDELTKAFTAVVGDKNAPSSRYSKVTRLFNKYLRERHEILKAQQEKVK